MTEFARGEALQQVIEETFSLEDGPIDLLLGGSENHVQILKPDVATDECVATNPRLYNPTTGEGCVQIPDHTTTTIGRRSLPGLFNTASREHCDIARDGDAVTVTNIKPRNKTFRVNPPKDHSIRAEFSEYSIASAEHPDRNEDASIIDEDVYQNMAGVFDGVSDSPESHRASQLAGKIIRDQLRGVPAIVPRILGLGSLREAFLEAHKAVIDLHPDTHTTAAAVKLMRDESGKAYAAIATTGDSRVHVLRDSKMSHTTLDHSYSANLTEHEQRYIQNTLSQVTDLSKLDPYELQAYRNRRRVASVLGGANMQPPTIDLFDLEIQPGDRIVLTTDGVHDNLTEKEITEIIADTFDIHDVARALVEAAKARSQLTKAEHIRAEVDDITAVSLEVTKV